MAIAAVLKDTQITDLKCASSLPPPHTRKPLIPSNTLHFFLNPSRLTSYAPVAASLTMS